MKDSTARTAAGALLGALIVIAVLGGSALVAGLFRIVRDRLLDGDERAAFGAIVLVAGILGALIYRRVDQ